MSRYPITSALLYDFRREMAEAYGESGAGEGPGPEFGFMTTVKATFEFAESLN